MYDIIELNGKKVADLRTIAKGLNIKKTESLKKQDLIYRILDEQAVNPIKKQSPPAKTSDKSAEKTKASKANVVPVAKSANGKTETKDLFSAMLNSK